MDEAKSLNNSYLKQLNASHSAEVKRLTEDRENIRATKDAKILSLERSMEAQRKKYESEINRQIIIIREQETTILNKNGKIMSLEEILSKKTDVERQLEECLRREQDNQAARDNL
jgi:hypothetical protein